MCDYSLHAVATRPAEVADTLISAKFQLRQLVALRAQITCTSRFASVRDEIASRRTFKLTVCCFARTSAIDWRDFAK